jgi:hypothetical protein
MGVLARDGSGVGHELNDSNDRGDAGDRAHGVVVSVVFLAVV